MPITTDPLVIQILNEYRAALDGMESSLMEDMARRWLEIEHRMDADIAALAQEMARRQAAGETITQQMVWRAERYQIIKAQLQDEIRQYNRDYAVGIITQAQEQYATLGINAAQSAIFASYPSPLSAGFTRINISAVESMIGLAGDGSPLYSLLKEDYGDAAEGLLNALINGLARGMSAGQIGREMAEGMGMGLDRALLIALTETARAYRTGSIAQYRESGVVSGFRRLVLKATACAACLFLDGEQFDVESMLDDHPRGKCTAVPVVQGVNPPEWNFGQDWFMDQSEARQKEILGPQKWQLWQENGFPLSQFAQHSHSDVWGDAPRIATITELLERMNEKSA